MVLLFLEFVLSEYMQIHAASAKAFVLYKKNYGKEVHRYYSNTLGGEYGKQGDALG